MRRSVEVELRHLGAGARVRDRVHYCVLWDGRCKQHEAPASWRVVWWWRRSLRLGGQSITVSNANLERTPYLLHPLATRPTGIFPRTASLFEANLSLLLRLVRRCPIQWMHFGCRAFPLGVAIWVSSSVVRISRRPATTRSRRKPPLDNRDSRGARNPYFTPSNIVDWRLARLHLGQRPSQTISSA